ncbi:MAG: PDZ domain-containing protein [Polyangiales bacterium]
MRFKRSTFAACSTFGVLGLLSGVLGSSSGCAYPRRSTLAHPAPPSADPTDAPNNLWSIHFVDANLPETKGGGLPWDSDGTDPDPYLRLVIDRRVVWESPVQENTRHPQWNVTLPRNIFVPARASFRIEIWDQDTASADPAGAIVSFGLPETALPNALAHLALDNTGTVTVTVAAPHASRGLGLEFEQHSDALYVLSIEQFSPAARAGLKVGERVVAIGDTRVESVSAARAASDLSLSVDRGATLKVTDASGHAEREVTLDRNYLWLIM